MPPSTALQHTSAANVWMPLGRSWRHARTHQGMQVVDGRTASAVRSAHCRLTAAQLCTRACTNGARVWSLTMTSMESRKNGAQSMNAELGDGWRNGANSSPTSPFPVRDWIDRCSFAQLPVNMLMTVVSANIARKPALMPSLM